MIESQSKLPLWYRPWFILPISVVTLYILGMSLTLPPNMIDPRKYPAFMDGGSDWGGSNIFFYSRVVMLLMGLLGFLSLSQLRPRPNWMEMSWQTTAKALGWIFRYHIGCFVACTLLLVPSMFDYDGGTWLALCVEIGAWYALSAMFAVSLLRYNNGYICFISSSVLVAVFLIVGFYLGYWVTGSGFSAHLIDLLVLLARVFVEMLVYAVCLMGIAWINRKVYEHRFLSAI